MAFLTSQHTLSNATPGPALHLLQTLPPQPAFLCSLSAHWHTFTAHLQLWINPWKVQHPLMP
eukprot:4932049-Ditylum_brightwellii.AAC.1